MHKEQVLRVLHPIFRLMSSKNYELVKFSVYMFYRLTNKAADAVVQYASDVMTSVI